MPFTASSAARKSSATRFARSTSRGGSIGRNRKAWGWTSTRLAGLDFFDASINRIAAWTIGTRSTLKSLLVALLEPPALRASEKDGDYTARLAWMEDSKTLPWGAVWDAYCESQNVPADGDWLAEVKRYESAVLSKR
jgi:L-rhamnose isomerase